MEHMVLFPVLLQLINGQTAEQFSLPAEVCMKRTRQKTLTETAGTGEKNVPVFSGKVVYVLCLVNIEKTILSYTGESLYAYRIYHTVSHLLPLPSL